MIDTNNTKCTACGACLNICPKKCIRFKQRKDGFMFPAVDSEKCINCSMCENVCPIGKDHDNNFQSKAYAAVINNVNQLKISTSGGAFSAIANYIFNLGGIVYGCAYGSNIKPEHIRIHKKDDLHLLNGSKYVQSDTNDTFSLVKKDLENGKYVLFSGTPCQIAGLMSFLKKPYDKLITVDIICHGVPSYAYFKKYIDWLGKCENVQITDFKFRSKKKGGWRLTGLYSGNDINTGKYIEKSINYFDSYYYYYFLHSSIYRECCYECEYANMNRQGDFTLGDLWGAEGLNLKFDTGYGCSLVLANSEKAKEIISKLNISISPVSIEDAVAHNEQLKKPSEKSAEREKYLRQFISWDADKINSYFVSKYKKDIILGKVKYMIPDKAKRMMLKIRYKK